MTFSTSNKSRRLQLIMACTLSLGLGACSSDMSDLHDFVHKAKTTQKTTLPPLPTIKPYETFRYSAMHLRDPFETATVKQASKVKVTGKGKGPRPVEGRAREVLEAFPLDSLRMVGTLEQNDIRWALIQSNDGTIHRIKKGNYIGQNHGKITDITEEKISLVEIVPDGLGDYMERPASMALVESQQGGK